MIVQLSGVSPTCERHKAWQVPRPDLAPAIVRYSKDRKQVIEGARNSFKYAQCHAKLSHGLKLAW